MKKWFEKLEQFNIVADVLKHIWPLIKLLSVAAGAMMLTFIVVNTAHKDEMAQYIAQYDEYRDGAVRANMMVDELRAQVAEKEALALSAMKTADVLRDRSRGKMVAVAANIQTVDSMMVAMVPLNDSVQLARVIIPLQADIIESQSVVIKTQLEENDALRDANTFYVQTHQLLTFAVDSLQQVVLNLPAPPKNPNTVFGFTKPTRTQMFIGGVVVGVIGTVALAGRR
jgi:hypothetical protein